MITVGVIYHDGRLRLDLDETQAISDVLQTLISHNQCYSGGSLRLAWPRDSPPLEPTAAIGSCLRHGDTLIASYPLSDEAPRNELLQPEADSPRTASEAFNPGSPESNEPKMCRICHDSDTTPETGRFISPCKCSGSMRFVHVGCLNQWRRLSANSQSYYQCDQCLFRYSFERARWAAWLTSEKVVLSATILVCFLLTTISAVIATKMSPHLAFTVYQFGRFQPFWYSPRHWTAPVFDFYVAGAAAVSMIGALMYFKREWDTWHDRPDALHHLIRHGLWFASMSHHSLSRIGLFVGLAVSYQCVFVAVKNLCLHWTTTYGEMLLDVSQS